jgi:hypothetical protein
VSIAETLAVFAGIPAAIVAVVFALVYGANGRRGSKRYRPGRPFTFAPVWFVAARDTAAVPAITAGDDAVSPQYGETGGASDRW